MYELERLKQTYGVSSPTLGYAGYVAPPAPVEPQESRYKDLPSESNFMSGLFNSSGNYETDLEKYKTDLAEYQKNMAANAAREAADRAEYERYRQQYLRNMSQGDMYNQAQFGGSGVYAQPLAMPSYSQSAPAAQPLPTVPENPSAYDGYGIFSKVFKRILNKSHGGEVRTHFATGGLNALSQSTGGEGEAPAVEAPVAAPAPVTPAQLAPVNPELMQIVSKYFPADDDYSAELRSARESSKKETQAFYDALQKAITQPSQSGPDKAEMYFRLAAAFGAPTKTGNFMEAVGRAGEAAAGIRKEQRESARESMLRNTQLGIEGQKLKMQSANEDLNTLRTLAAKGMESKRAIATELIKDYVKSGQPQSSAGKQAQDEGLKPGTPEFQKRVAQIADMNVERQMASINSTLANMSVAQANLALNQQKFQNVQEQQKKLTPAEVKLKGESEATLGSIDDAMASLKRAYSLNPQTFDGTLVDLGRRKLMEQTDPKDPRVLATREQENLLSKGGVEKLRASFGGNPTEGERKILLQLEGIDSKSKDERKLIMQNTYRALKARREREQKRFNEITQGLYRETGAPAGEID